MDTHEHAQQIYSLMLLAHRLNKEAVPAGQQLEHLALSCMTWADAFRAAAAKKKQP